MSCVTCELTNLVVIPRLARECTEATAALRAVEHQAGLEATEDTGRYWLARTAAFEHLATQAQAVVDGHAPVDSLTARLQALDRIPAPMCRVGDHAVAA